MLKKICKIIISILLVFSMCACTNDINNLNKEENENMNVQNEDIITKLTNETPIGYKLYIHNVDLSSTFGNSFQPSDYINIYCDVGIVMVNNKLTSYNGSIINNVKVLAVLDENNENVFSDNEIKTPSKIMFYLSDNDYNLLEKAKKLGKIELIEGNTNNVNKEVIDYVLNN